MRVRITNLGGIITELHAPDAHGRLADVVLGYDKLNDYLESNLYFGAIIGRWANRISNSRFELVGETFQLNLNENNKHNIHGGPAGFHKQVWNARTEKAANEVRLILERVSPHMEEGFPGELKVKAIYGLNSKNELKIEFSAETDQSTIVNLTGHSYFNLAGHLSGGIENHQLEINANYITPTDQELIPTGEMAPLESSPLDFRTPRIIDKALKENQAPFDHNFVLDTNHDSIIPAAVLKDPSTGRIMTIYTDAPCLQLYTGHKIPSNTAGKAGAAYGPYSGLCLEPQSFPNAINTPAFPTTILKPGQEYKRTIIYGFGNFIE